MIEFFVVLSTFYILILYIKLGLFHPLFVFSLLINIYSLYTIYVSDILNKTHIFNKEYIIIGYIAGIISLISFNLGFILSNISFKVRMPPILKSDIHLVPKNMLYISIFFLLFGIFSALFSIKYVAGDIAWFMNNLHLRQAIYIGKTWTIAPVFSLKLSLFFAIIAYLYHKTLDKNLKTKLMEAFYKMHIIICFIICMFILSILGGRLLGIVFLLNVLFIYMTFKKLRVMHYIFFISISFIIIFIYGLYRFGQGIKTYSTIDFIYKALTNFDMLVSIVIDNFFDSWFSLILFIEYYHNNHTYGLFMLSSLMKAAPKLYSLFVYNYIPFIENLKQELTFRTVSSIAYAYADLNLAGNIVYFSCLGMFLGILYKNWYRYIHDYKNILNKLLWSYFYSIFFTNSMIFIRSGPATAFTWLYVDLIWFICSILIIKTLGNKKIVLKR